MNFFNKPYKSIYKDDISEYFLTDICTLNKKYKIKNWRLNRKVDPSRINDIKSYLLTNKCTILPGIISGWEIDGDLSQAKSMKDLEIYDGYHRICAAIDSNISLLIRISKCNLDIIKDDFKSINQSISVPYLYLEENNIKKRQIIENVVDKFCETYPNNVSPKRNCQKQNFNRDNFISLLQNLEIDFFIENLDVKIYQILLGLNNQAKIYVKTNKITTPKKCDYYQFWLFYLEQQTILVKIKEELH